MTEPGTTQFKAIGKWQAKVSADIERWERIRSKGAVSGYTGTHGEDTGIEYVLGQRGQETTQPEAIGSGLTARPGVKTPQHLARSPLYRTRRSCHALKASAQFDSGDGATIKLDK